MPSYNDLYVSTVHFTIHSLNRSGKIPGYGFAKPSQLAMRKHDETVIALMVIVEKDPKPREVERGRVVPLKEVLNDIPLTLQDGTLSWLILAGVAEPSALIIHKGIAMEKLSLFAETRLMKKAFDTPLKSLFGFFHFQKLFEKARAQAKQSTLANSEPVANYMR